MFLVSAAGLAAVTLQAAAPAAAAPSGPQAPAAGTITATYPVTGSTFISKVNGTVSLGPGTLVSTLNLSTSALTSTLTLPPATGTFKIFGFIPVTATTELIQNGPATGTLTHGVVTTTASVTVKLDSLSIAGIPILIGDECQTSSAASITVTSQPGFNLLNGGNLAGTYTIPNFSHCGLATFLINLTLPGPNNTITLTLGKAKLS
jgi:hypothetical protein